ncbi:MAG: rhombosortase [Opitutaceae bacterium]
MSSSQRALSAAAGVRDGVGGNAVHPGASRARCRLPFLTLALSLAALAVWALPGVAAALQFDRAALGAGEWWRFVTGHWAHWSGEHLAWDLVVFAVFGAMLEARSRRGLAVVVAGAALAISGAVALGARSLAFYRGLSGIDSALFTAFFAQLLGDARRERAVLPALVPAVALLGFVGKAVYELVTGATLFVSADSTFVVVPLAHVVGAGVGAAVVVAQGTFRCATLLRTEPQPT